MKKRIISAVLLIAFAVVLGGCAKTEGGNGQSAAAQTGNTGEVALVTGDTYAEIDFEGYGKVTLKLYPQYAPRAVEEFVSLANEGYYNGKNVHRVISDFMLQGGSFDGTGQSDPSAESYEIEISPEMRHFYGAVCMGKNALGEVGAQFYIVNSKDTSAYTNILSSIDIIKQNADTALEYLDEVKAAVEKGEADPLFINYYETSYNNFKMLADYTETATEEVKTKYAEQGGTPSLDGGYTVFGQTVDGFDVIDKISAVEVAVDANGEASSPVEEILIKSVEIKTF